MRYALHQDVRPEEMNELSRGVRPEEMGERKEAVDSLCLSLS